MVSPWSNSQEGVKKAELIDSFEIISMLMFKISQYFYFLSVFDNIPVDEKSLSVSCCNVWL